MELEAEEAGEAAAAVGAAVVDLSGRGVLAAAGKRGGGKGPAGDWDDSDADDDDYSDNESQWDLEEVEVTEDDEKALEAFMVSSLHPCSSYGSRRVPAL